MSRSVQWQRNISDATSWHQDEALNSVIYILREIGPTSFLLQEEGEEKKYRISLGDPHVCTCATFKKEKALCKHICWVLLKKFKLDRFNEVSYQLGLVEREINQLLKNFTCSTSQNGKVKSKAPIRAKNGERASIKRRDLTDDDVCPICQEELLTDHQPITFCKYGCGNSVHIKCMKVWADHQLQAQKNNPSIYVKCPFCREDFCTGTQLKMEYQTTLTDQLQDRTKRQSDGLDSHFGCACRGCDMNPIRGKCYKCTSCDEYYICNTCHHSSFHAHHNLVVRLKKSQRWRPDTNKGGGGEGDMSSGTNSRLAHQLAGREITENDYDLLLQLDGLHNAAGDEIPVDLAGLPDHIINRLPVSKVNSGSRLLAPGRQCRLCLHTYIVGQFLRKLPCGHVFHRECADKWLREDHRCCPVDRKSVLEGLQDQISLSPSTSSISKQATKSRSRGERRSHAVENFDDLCIPGIGIIHTAPPRSAPITRKSTFRRKTKNHIRRQQQSLFDPTTNERLPVLVNDKTLAPMTMHDLVREAETRVLGRNAKSSNQKTIIHTLLSGSGRNHSTNGSKTNSSRGRHTKSATHLRCGGVASLNPPPQSTTNPWRPAVTRNSDFPFSISGLCINGSNTNATGKVQRGTHSKIEMRPKASVSSIQETNCMKAYGTQASPVHAPPSTPREDED